jgi:hypothetical protein
MSVIIYKLTCENCKKEYDGYWSFGHPTHEYDWQWECEECKFINTYHVLPFFQWLQTLENEE